jgi:RNA polymerase sigma-70 factor (ECF subfamily)
VPIGTVMSRLSRARQTIGALFGVRDSQKTKVAVASKDPVS